jgi:hypothetical protein
VGTGATNTAATQGTKNGSLFVAVERATAAVAHTSSVVATGHADARSSTGLIFKDSSSGTAQTATVVAGTVLSLYAQVSTTTAFSVTGGTLAVSATAVGMTLTADSFTSTMAQALFSAASAAATTATPVAVLWTAPTTVGSYTVTMRTSTAASQAILASGGTSHNLVVTVLASATANHSVVGGDNNVATNGRNNESLYVAVASNSGAAAVVGGTAGSTSDVAAIEDSARSKGLLYKDSSNGTAQTATVLAGGVLSLYASVSTASAFSATGGSFSSAYGGAAGNSPYYNSTNTYVGVGTATTSTGVAVLWTAPTTAGTYTVSLLTGFSANEAVSEVQTAANGLVPPTLSGQILVSVVASSAGGAFAASNSTCTVQMTGDAVAFDGTAKIDTTDIFEDGQAPYIAFDLNDAYAANLDAGNITVTATNGALVNVAASAATLLAGTSSTDILAGDGSSTSVRIDQPTAGAPLTTTVTVSYNGTPVCTKTVSIRGAVAKLTVANIASQKTSAAVGANGSQWMYQKTGIYTAGQFTVVATDSAGNVVSTDSTLGTYAANSGTGVQVPAIAVDTRSSTANASSPLAYNFGSFGCGPDAGQSTVTIKFTTTATGKTVVSDPFTARCAGDASTYTVSLDKAAYTQGEIAKATVKFLDSKGNKANNMTAIGANSWVLPYMTAVDSTITATTGASATSVTDGNGEVVYTFTVGSSTAVAVSGTYTGVVEFSAPALGVKSTPTYKLTVGSGDTSFTEVLKSVVALIASINKQIQALQKLILKRR